MKRSTIYIILGCAAVLIAGAIIYLTQKNKKKPTDTGTGTTSLLQQVQPPALNAPAKAVVLTTDTNPNQGWNPATISTAGTLMNSLSAS